MSDKQPHFKVTGHAPSDYKEKYTWLRIEVNGEERWYKWNRGPMPVGKKEEVIEVKDE